MEKKKCQNCVELIDNKSKFCYKCGGTEFKQDESMVKILGILAGIIAVLYVIVSSVK